MLVLVGLALLSFLINTIFEFFIVRVGERIDKLGKKYSDEKARRISFETSAMVTQNIATRPGTIVRHEDIADKTGYAEAVETSRYIALDPLTTLPNRHMINEHTDIKILDYKKTFSDAADKGTMCDIHPIYAIYLTVADPVRFSQSNGHIVVDLFIQTMAHRLREAADSKVTSSDVSPTTSSRSSPQDLGDDTEFSSTLSRSRRLLMKRQTETSSQVFCTVPQRRHVCRRAHPARAEAAMYDAVNEDTDAKIYEPNSEGQDAPSSKILL